MKTKITVIFSFLVILILSACSKNPFAGTWTGSNIKGIFTVEIKKDNTFFLQQDIPKHQEVCTIKGTWEKIDDSTIMLTYSTLTISSSKNGMWQLDANAKEYSADPGILYLRSDGAFGDSRESMYDFYLKKEK